MLEKIKHLCLVSPHWMQIEFQAFWYGLLSITMELIEDNKYLPESQLNIENCLQLADPEFSVWPTDWLKCFGTEFLSLNMNLEEQQKFYGQIETIFLDTIPVDLNIFTVLAEGEELTEDQWERLYDTIAFMPPAVNKLLHQKTKRVHGKRGLTPLKRRKANTFHKTHHVHILKLPPK